MLSVGVGGHELSADRKNSDDVSAHLQDTFHFFENALAVMSPRENRDDLHEDVRQSSRSEFVVREAISTEKLQHSR